MAAIGGCEPFYILPTGLYFSGAMDFSELQALLRRHKNVVVFAALVSLVAGLDLLLNPPVEGAIDILSLPFLAAAAFLLAVVLWPTELKAPSGPPADTLAHRFFSKVTLSFRLVPYFPVAGIVIIAIDAAYNAFLSPSPVLQIHDTVTILFGVTLIAYPFVPQRFDRERDFVMLFFLVLVLILVVPLVLVRLYKGDFDQGVNAYSSAALAPELQGVLSLLGISNRSVPPDPSFLGAPGIQFLTQRGDWITVVITTSCSGIYSFSIFASAFTAFILTEFRKTDWRVWTLLVLGFVASYIANLLRMTVIVATGYFSITSPDDVGLMLVAHSNVGWLIFLGWISLFWVLMYRFLFPRKERPATAKSKKMSRCTICGEPLSPTIAGTMCECGRMYHASCLQDEGQCPACHTPVSRPDSESKALT